MCRQVTCHFFKPAVSFSFAIIAIMRNITKEIRRYFYHMQVTGFSAHIFKVHVNPTNDFHWSLSYQSDFVINLSWHSL